VESSLFHFLHFLIFIRLASEIIFINKTLLIMKKTLLVLTTIISSMTFAQDCSDLFISEYVEGYGNNKALEIYNPTASTIDLSNYEITRYSGGTTAPAASYTVQLVGMIAPYSTHVGVVDKQDQNGTGNEAPVWDDLAAKADAWYSPVYATSPCWYWNGDDGIALTKSGTTILVDFFGKLGQDPGVSWTSVAPYDDSAGDYLTKDHSLIRKAYIYQGDVIPGDDFNALLEYDSIPPTIMDGGIEVGNWASLGTHDCDCNAGSVSEINESNVSIYPNPSNGVFSVKGIENFETVSVINSLGQNVQTINNNTKSVVNFAMNNLRGVYFVKLTDANGTVVTKRAIIK
jgi:hypothetical protein